MGTLTLLNVPPHPSLAALAARTREAREVQRTKSATEYAEHLQTWPELEPYAEQMDRFFARAVGEMKAAKVEPKRLFVVEVGSYHGGVED